MADWGKEVEAKIRVRKMRKEWSVILPDCVSYLATLIGAVPLLPIEITAIFPALQLTPPEAQPGQQPKALPTRAFPSRHKASATERQNLSRASLRFP